MSNLVFVLILSPLLVWISIFDSREFRIPDRAIVIGLLIVSTMAIVGWLNPWLSFLGIIFALAQTGLVRLLVPSGFGLGDVKLAIVIGAFLGPVSWLIIGLTASILAIIALIPSMIHGRVSANERIPLAPFISCSALIIGIITGKQL